MSDAKQTDQAVKTRSLYSVGGLALVFLILVFVNVLFSGVTLRWDATADNLYSLSEGTRSILADLKQDVTLKVFYTRKNVNTPVHIQNYAERMLDFLAEYENYSNGKVTVEVYDTQTDTEEEDWARKYGLEAVNLPGGDRIYLGLVALAADQEEVIPMMDPARESQLEYDITRIISRVQSPEKQTIGVISGLPVFGGPPPAMAMQMRQPAADPWLFISELEKTYNVEEIGMEAEDIGDADLLLIIHPMNLSDKLQYAVDQYVMKGGNVCVFADAFAISDQTQSPMKSSSLDKLFSAWGATMESRKILVDFDNATKLRTQNNQVETNPAWLSLDPSAFNADDIITAQLDSLLMPMAGTFQKLPGSEYDYEPLVQSSKNSALMDAFQMRFGMDFLRKDFKATNQVHDLAVKIRGKFNSAFPDGPPAETPENGDAEKPAPAAAPEKGLTEGEKAATVILVGDADMLFDQYYVSRQNFLGLNLSRIFNDNLNFLLNAGEVLTGSEALIGIRSRGQFARPFTRVEELEKKAQARWLDREQELTRKAEETNQKLREFEKQKDASQKFVLSAEQEEEIERFRQEKIRINQELKKVRRNLRAEIESLGNKLKFINIFLTPLLVSLVGLGYGLYRRRKSHQTE